MSVYGLVILFTWLFWPALPASAQTIKAPALYEQCQSLTENPAAAATVTQAATALKSPDAKKRSEAAQILAKTCDSRAVDLLLTALKDDEATVRVAAVEALGQLGHPDTIDLLIETLQDSDWRVRAALGLSLGSFNIHKARNAVLNSLVNTGSGKMGEEGDLRARCLGVLVVNQMRDVRFSRKGIKFLFEFLNINDPRQRQLAEATATELQHTRNGLHELIGILQQDSFSDFRRKAAYWLGQWGLEEARGALAQASVGDKDAGVQQVAKEALAKLPKK
jgi:HEAT repeat protein